MACAHFLLHLQEKDIAVAIEANLSDPLHMPGLFSLLPEPTPGPAVVVREAGFHRPPEGLPVHIGHHQDMARPGILGDGRDQAFFVKFQITGEFRHAEPSVVSSSQRRPWSGSQFTERQRGNEQHRCFPREHKPRTANMSRSAIGARRCRAL